MRLALRGGDAKYQIEATAAFFVSNVKQRLKYSFIAVEKSAALELCRVEEQRCNHRLFTTGSLVSAFFKYLIEFYVEGILRIIKT